MQRDEPDYDFVDYSAALRYEDLSLNGVLAECERIYNALMRALVKGVYPGRKGEARMIKLRDRNHAFLTAIYLAFFLLGACSRLPDYSRPRIETDSTAFSLEGIPYRALTPADFQATALPVDLREHHLHLNAHSSVAIRTRPGARYVVSPGGGKNEDHHCAHAENLTFQALIIPEKSWWSSTLAKDRQSYVLQHEQVHFALMEVAARRLNRRIKVEGERLSLCDVDQETVVKRLSARIDAWLADSETESLKWHREFDEATSQLYAPRLQQWWYERVMRELSDLAEWQGKDE